MRCGSEIAAAILACPSCGKLVHTEELERLSREAGEREAAGDGPGALASWQRVNELLPPGTKQSARVLEHIRRLDTALPAAHKTPWGTLAAVGALVAGGLTKLGTVLSMAAMIGVYWASYGWKFAFGVVGSIYIHEMGHVVALRGYGIEASAPMFVPGLGAFVRSKHYPPTPRADAHVGLAGPMWGLGAALAARAVAYATDSEAWAAIASVGALINLFNLLPLGTLDGGRGIRSLSRAQRLALAVTCAAVWAWSRHWLPAAIGILTLIRAPASDAPRDPDHLGLLRFAGLLVALSLLAAKL